MIKLIFLGIQEYKSGFGLGYMEVNCASIQSALNMKFDHLNVYKIIYPSSYPGVEPVSVFYHKDPDNDISRKLFPK